MTNEIDGILRSYMEQRAVLNRDLIFCFGQRGVYDNDHETPYYNKRIKALDDRIAGIDKLVVHLVGKEEEKQNDK